MRPRFSTEPTASLIALMALLISEFPSASLTGADFSESKISNCRILYPQIDFEVRDIYNQLKSSYDLILCTEVLEHLLYPDRALKMLLNGINEHGSIFITVPNGRLDSFSGHINFWSPESWKVFLEENIYTKLWLQIMIPLLF